LRQIRALLWATTFVQTAFIHVMVVAEYKDGGFVALVALVTGIDYRKTIENPRQSLQENSENEHVDERSCSRETMTHLGTVVGLDIWIDGAVVDISELTNN